MTGREEPRYRAPFAARFGEEAVPMGRMLVFGAPLAMFGAVAGVYIANGRGASVLGTVIWTGGMALLAGLAGIVAMVILTRGAGAGLKAFIQPSGGGSPYKAQFSYEDARVVRGDIAGALESYESHLKSDRTSVALRIQTAELYAGAGGDVARAAELYREAQRLPGISSREHVYATQRLIDLYLGPLKKPDNAISELRQLIHKYPTSDIARHARVALVEIKRSLPAQPGT